MTDETLQPVDMHKAFKRDPDQRDASRIVYVNLDNAAAQAKKQENARLRAFFAAPEGSIEELDAARKAAIGYFVLTGAQLQTAPIREVAKVSERFTQASIELYGKPDAEEARSLASRELEEFKQLVDDPNVDQDRLHRSIDFLTQQIGETSSEKEIIDLESVLRQMREVIYKRYGDVLALLEPEGKDPTEEISAEEVAKLFQEAINFMAQSEPGWAGWRVETSKDAVMETHTREKLITVGSNARQISSLKVSFAHEVLVHALRSVNGATTGDDLLAHGTPGSQAAEEGVSVLFASSVRGHISDRSKDFYKDIAFALGELGQPPVKRAQLQQIYLDRLIIRDQAKNKPVDMDALSNKAWGYVNRIFRGALGNEDSSVNTLDISYYGVTVMGNYVKRLLANGRTPDEIFDFLTCAKIDPTNAEDLRHRIKVIDSSYNEGVENA